MKISPIANYQIRKNVFAKQNNNPFYAKNNYSPIYDTYLKRKEAENPVNFCGFLFGKKDDRYSYNNFIEAAKRCGINSLQDLKSNVRIENLIGAGANSKVYKFDNPKLNRWVLKEDIYPFIKPAEGLFEAVKDDFEGRNLGQEIAKSGRKYRILKKVEGTTHSIENWSKRIDNGSFVDRKDSLEFIDSLNKIQNFPQSSFDDYAQDLRIIGEKGYKQDSINPNNILIDYKKKKIQIIDFFKVADPSHVDSRYDLSSVLLDFSLFSQFYDNLDENEQKQMVKYANNIINKCAIASKKAGIRQDEHTFLNFLANVDKWFGAPLIDKGGDYRTRYAKMKAILEKNS